jgi:TRAP-type C4-dicarboxylate transport system permease small subunit
MNPLSAAHSLRRRAPANALSGIAAASTACSAAPSKRWPRCWCWPRSCVLFAGVVARYVFHAPLVWSDELASILFLWLSMLGAVVALRRGEHMRMTALCKRSPSARAPCSTRWRHRRFDRFLVLVIWPYRLRARRAFIVTPALEISNAWRAAAIPAAWR